MKRILLVGFTLILLYMEHAHAQSDTTTHITNFSIIEQNITLKIGESCQLHTDPSSTDVRWSERNLSANAVLFVDKNGYITAVRAGNEVVSASSKANPNIYSLCNVTVSNEGSIIKNIKSLTPVNEVQESEIKFSLTNDGLFTAEGTYWGSGVQTNYLNYVVTNQCIIMYFEIDYSDSTKMFYPQPFKLELEGCNAEEYNIYLNNRIQTVESQGQYARYSLKRGSTAGGTTNVEGILIRKYDNVIYNLQGQELETAPSKGIYIRNGKKLINNK